jgi:hypothetical protein
MKLKNHFLTAFLYACAVLLFALTVAEACQDGVTAPEEAWANAWGSCQQNIINYIFNKWDLTDDSWQPAGAQDNCNEALPFAKVINAVVFISNGPHEQLGGFHDTVDYNNESRSTSSAYHGDVYLRFIENGGGAEATSEWGRFDAEDRTDLHCPIFNFPGNINPVNTNAEMLDERASVLVHEMWHHSLYAQGYDPSHFNGPTGNCVASGSACDRYYFHTPDFKLPDGTLSSQIGNLNRNVVVNNVGVYFHSPYQLMVEFDADMALFPNADWVPFAVRLEAQSVGNNHIASNFLNTVPFSIGTPSPFPTYVPRQNP